MVHNGIAKDMPDVFVVVLQFEFLGLKDFLNSFNISLKLGKVEIINYGEGFCCNQLFKKKANKTNVSL